MWTAKRPVLVRYHGYPNLYHGRFLLAAVQTDPQEWITVTPDGDTYPEDLSTRSREVAEVRDRGSQQIIPFGMRGDRIYDFDQVVTEAQLDLLVADATVLARQERTRRGLPEPVVAADAVVDGGAGGGEPPAADGGALGGAPDAAARGGGARPGGDGGVMVGLGGHVGGAPAVRGDVSGLAPGSMGGLDALGALVGMDGGSGAITPGRPRGGLLHGGAGAGDLRTLPCKYDHNGHRSRDFSEAVQLLEEVQFDDFPIKGPRTVAWCLRFMLSNGGTPRGWHTKWRSEGRLLATDGGVQTHDGACQLLEVMCCYDQLNVGNLACAELVCRQLQLTEERWRERFTSADSADSESNLHLYLGGASRGNLCISPMLQEWIADELRKESAVSKERRKAREERALIKPKSKGKKGGDDA